METNGLYQGAALSPGNARSMNATAHNGASDASAEPVIKDLHVFVHMLTCKIWNPSKKQLSAQLGWGA